MRVNAVPGWLLVLLGASLWGTAGTAQAFLPSEVTPAQTATVRLVIGGALLGFFVLLLRPKTVAPSSVTMKRGLVALLITASAVSIVLFQVCFFSGVRATGVAVGTLVAIGSGPVFTGLLGLLLRERITSRWMTATGIVLTGLVLLLAPWSGDPVDWNGVLFALGAGLAYACYTVLARLLLLNGVPGETIVASLFVIAAVLLVLTQLGEDFSWVFTSDALVAALWLGVAATAIPYFLWIKGLASVTAASAATVTLAEPLVAALLAVTLLAEPLTVLGAAGVAAIIAGMVLIARSPGSAPRQHSEN
ncbi:DMT family transporter [Hoyosella altamirensis]|uniref:DME family drug/metabolite transporter n=1 Tax=Hoyosella altamirensis TaxID=616997 RepID=A0A839RJ42_9ACTN|nr:EamA family transporter [Hoyosella altamirensis]MBB3036417.1 DME family drug/metabolite transporter [Hoyosella altamirensis]